MASDYEEICRQNREDYGKKGAKKSGDLAAGLYDDETHFIYELLQNTEDALKRRDEGWKGSRQINFILDDIRLVLSHYGHPFTENDVRSVCDISESTKDESSIGRFGLGFKSVYKVSDLPEIHSGDEDFVIEEYLFPKQAERTRRDADETQILLPLKADSAKFKARIGAGLKALGASSLLFLRHIREISWRIEGGASGLYLRDDPEVLGNNVSRIKLIGQATGQADIDQDWLVFHRDVGKGRVELAFSVITDKDDKSKWGVQPLPASPLVVFFPTAYQTNLGFYLQGPFQSTPSRDNIRNDEPWNHRLIAEAASLLVEAMTWLRDNNRLDVNALRCLPLDRVKFPDGRLFSPMFEATLEAFKAQPFLPNNDGGYSLAEESKLADSAGLAELFSSDQISALYEIENTHWLTGKITDRRTADIWNYLTKELGVKEVRPRDIFPTLTKQFLEAQSDEWIAGMYEFLKDQGTVKSLLSNTPIVRLENGSHVSGKTPGGEPRAFLPTGSPTGFPTVLASVCQSEDAIEFLKALGIGEPDPVDDVIRNILPKYEAETIEIDDEAYASDIGKIASAYQMADSTIKKSQLVERLKRTSFLMVVDCGDGNGYRGLPGNTYIATDRMKRLFSGAVGIFVVDDDYDCLRGEDVRNVLVASGASRYLRPKEIRNSLDFTKRRELQIASGYPASTWRTDKDQDWVIEGLDQIVALLPTLPADECIARAKLIWETLEELESNAAKHFFTGTYWWTNRAPYHANFPPSFVRLLTESSWIPDSKGELYQPKNIAFEATGWKANPFLQSKIIFRPDLIDQLAEEIGIDPGELNLLLKLKRQGISLASLVDDSLDAATSPEGRPAPQAPDAPAPATADDPDRPAPGDSVYDKNIDLYGPDVPEIPEGTYDPDSGDAEADRPTHPINEGAGRGASPGGDSRSDGNGGYHPGTPSGGGPPFGTREHGKRTPGSLGGRRFISYVGTRPDEAEDDPDGLDQSQRMSIEAEAIKHIIEAEPHLHKTEAGNPGFDLLEKDASNLPVRWIEIKAMTESLEHRPVTLSHTQFKHALQKQNRYWLYVVEFATVPEQRRILRIQNPAGNAKSFTFDKGWKHIALTNPPTEGA
ncbi:DUF3883 domain-containing protein [Stenotrophomonas sp. 169]|uniref:sacsin N-terminal ATP-binding-like domain-containing protein n=1 Tax=Stenotrophomonas sp. 169 TaxID=2770322 RepID=UPI001CB7A289|nr:DUF3883 domain-containing protein [Stenotrophomonas sp. 169]